MNEPSPGAAAPAPATSDARAARLAMYVPQPLRAALADASAPRAWTAEGTAVFVDVTGFTRLSEALASRGREGAEQITDIIGRSFGAILLDATGLGGTLLKFGGDALLLWFEGDGHLARACDAAVRMRARLAETGRIALPGEEIVLQMSQGLHGGRFHFFAAGATHLDLVTTGPGWTTLVAMEHAATAGEILVSGETAAALDPALLGAARAGGRLLERAPAGERRHARAASATLDAAALAHGLPPALRAHAEAGGGAPEHRAVTVAFLRCEGTDALIATGGPAAALDAIDATLRAVSAAVESREIALLGSDVDADGFKLILAAGAPRVTGDDEERMLLALRAIVEAPPALATRVGVHRGAVFAGDIGPAYRRTYTVMGDVVNLAARVMARAAPGEILATAEVLDRSTTLFDAAAIEPFQAKGKAEPVRAWRVGRARGSRARQASAQRLPLTGRNAEMQVARKALAAARGGTGAWLEIVGDAGVGKTRLVEAIGDAAMGFRKFVATCEAYTADTPYAAWREILRDLVGAEREDGDDLVAGRLAAAVGEHAPDLAPWMPLLGAVAGAEVPATPEVEMLVEKNRRAKLHEVVARFLEAALTGPTLVALENAQHLDEASADLLASLARPASPRKWLVTVARRPSSRASRMPEGTTTRIDLGPLAAADALRMAELASKDSPLPHHALEVVAQRSGGNPQFLRDLLRSAQASGGVAALPDSAEAAAMARIDALAPGDRVLVRRASVFGMAFHPRMLRWFDEGDGASAPDDDAWMRLADLFDDDGDGYLRFRQSLLRDSAYEGLPFRQRRELHARIAERIAAEADDPEESAALLSLHYHVAGDYAATWRYAALAADRAADAYAYVEAAGYRARAVDAGTRLGTLAAVELARAHEALGDAWNRTGEFRKAADSYTEALRLAAGTPLAEAGLLLKHSWLEEKLGRYPEALRKLDQAREALAAAVGREAAALGARTSAWTATVLQAQGNTAEAVCWAERTMEEAHAADDAEALGTAHFVLGWAAGILGKPGGEAMLEQAVEAFARAGNRARQAATLSNLGVICQWEGRWDDAMAYYERGREESLKVGNRVDAAVSRINVAEILIDRGEIAEAEAMLQQTMSLWQSSEYRYFLGATLWMLGRASLRAGRHVEALERLGLARGHLEHVGASAEVQDVDARIAEARVLEREADAALAIADRLLAAGRDGDEGVARLVPVLERTRGHALLLQFDPYAAREALDASLAAARGRNDRYEIAVTLRSLAELDRLEGIEPAAEALEEGRALLAKLKVRALPPLPSFG